MMNFVLSLNIICAIRFRTVEVHKMLFERNLEANFATT